MKNKITYIFAIFAIIITTTYGQNNPWKNVKSRSNKSNNELLERTNFPKDYQVLSLDFNQLKNSTGKTVNYTDATKQNRSNAVVVSMPTPDGDFIDFEIYEQQDVESGLAKKFPNLKSYTGSSTKDKSIKINFTVNALGFNGIITSPHFSSIYIDSYNQDLTQYIVYYRKDLERIKQFTCLDNSTSLIEESSVQQRGFVKRSSDGVYRDYRIAIACTVEYSNFHINRVNGQNKTDVEKKEIVLSAMQTTLNRVNAVYKRDLAIHLTLVANNDAIVFLYTDDFSNSNATELVNQSQTVIDTYIGTNNYDVGHTFSTGAGGLAYLQIPCDPSMKAKGVTGAEQPINDPYDIDYVAHEIGHQFGATHTFSNRCGDNQRQDETAYEPGSGSTIMGYAGICAPNVANNSDDYFHFINIKQINDFITTGGNCSVNTPINNTAPIVSELINYVIPYGTPFKLTATATDRENDILTYAWDQLDNGITASISLPSTTATRGPAFRSITPNTSSARYFPEYSSVLNGILATQWEVIPEVARTLNFGVTVRDNNSIAGQVTQKQNRITVANTGPFKITSPESETTSWQRNSNQTVRWNVAGTTSNGINVNTVNILLSVDGGATYQMLAENTPNDGSETITIPDVATKEAYIMIEANGNVFYALSKKFSIDYKLVIEQFCKEYSLTYANGYAIQDPSTGYSFTFNVAESENFEIKDIKLNADISANQSSNVNIYFKNSDESGTYSNTIYRNLSCASSQNIKAIFSNNGMLSNCSNINTNANVLPTELFSAINKMANGQWNVLVSKNNFSQVKVNKLTLTLCGEKRTYIDIDKKPEKGLFAVYPNPSNGLFKFYLESETDIEVTVFDITGKLLLNKTINASNNTIYDVNLTTLSKGVYILKVSNGLFRKVEKIIIN